jgi:hypothetical protein
MDVHEFVNVRMVAWQSLFLLQYRETTEVLLPGSQVQEFLQKRNFEWRQMM